MLKSLAIKNFAVISELRLDLSDGLNVFTGQTGAGKSILIEALGFLLGSRGSLEWLRAGAHRLEVQGVFDAQDAPDALRSRFSIREPAFAVRRELDASGRSKAYLHNQSVPSSALSQMGDGLVDFHGQHEHQTLLKPSVQLDLLDGFGGMGPLREKLEEAWRRWSGLDAERRSLELSDEERLRRVDMYRFQIRDIDETAPGPREEGELEAVLPRLKNAERIHSLSRQAYALLYEQEGSIQENLLKAERALEELVRLDPAMAEPQQSLAQAGILVGEVSGRLAAYGDPADAGPDKLDAILSRLDRLHRLKKKYGATLADVLEYRDRIRKELAWLEDSRSRTAELTQALSAAREELARLCAKAHRERLRAGELLCDRATRELQGLGMGAARLSVCVEMEEDAAGPTGSDRVEFLVSANPGEPLKPLKSVASGGELSRVMLALKTIFASNDRVKVLVFDEVDAGVGGEVGLAVGRRLGELGRSRQVLCVTHLPQVACFARRHFHVSKDVEGGRTFVRVEGLEGAGRLEVVARMLGGRDATPASRKHARELLEACDPASGVPRLESPPDRVSQEKAGRRS